MEKKKLGLLVMAYGTPTKEEEIEPYYTHIRHGRKPEADALQDLKDRYKAIGGVSPLAKITEQQASALEAQLNEVQDDYEYKAYIGLKHIAPFIEDAVAEMANDGVTEAVSIVLAPHYSTFSVKSYNDRAANEAAKHGITIEAVESWYTEPGFIKFWADGVKEIFGNMSEAERDKAVLIVSAHSLPEKILQNGDPYPNQLKETAELLVEASGVKHYALGWQSEGNTPDPWLGPDVQDLTRELYDREGFRSFVYAPVGFVADHLEVLFDNDYECKVVCDEIGAKYYRPEMPNVAPLFIETLANVVLKKVKSEV
ncbi:ferrochelatase [Oceanobacillus chungangensis]|uniref:Coproporphyrin III ferrochelatase n=1 Tax=Oceanobacillus chungangensis TaxID=1229152 RepID=A0A3D8PYR4_9BACI|nr:ferrochelatase [Oceanobacillus chungangensis]RDW19915.1 ferrochelatase [Oceanobacillus chungangensis]